MEISPSNCQATFGHLSNYIHVYVVLTFDVVIPVKLKLNLITHVAVNIDQQNESLSNTFATDKLVYQFSVNLAIYASHVLRLKKE